MSIPRCPLCRSITLPSCIHLIATYPDGSKIQPLTENFICSICLENEDDKLCEFEKCKHRFHIKCIKHIFDDAELLIETIREPFPTNITFYYKNKKVMWVDNHEQYYYSILVLIPENKPFLSSDLNTKEEHPWTPSGYASKKIKFNNIVIWTCCLS